MNDDLILAHDHVLNLEAQLKAVRAELEEARRWKPKCLPLSYRDRTPEEWHRHTDKFIEELQSTRDTAQARAESAEEAAAHWKKAHTEDCAELRGRAEFAEARIREIAQHANELLHGGDPRKTVTALTALANLCASSKPKPEVHEECPDNPCPAVFPYCERPEPKPRGMTPEEADAHEEILESLSSPLPYSLEGVEEAKRERFEGECGTLFADAASFRIHLEEGCEHCDLIVDEALPEMKEAESKALRQRVQELEGAGEELLNWAEGHSCADLECEDDCPVKEAVVVFRRAALSEGVEK